MIRNFFIALGCLQLFSCQNTSVPALEDSTLKMEYGSNGCNFIENPNYIVNKDYVVYQDVCTHIVIYPDLASFKVAKNTESGFAFDKNGMYVKGEFFKIDTTGFAVLGINKEKDILWKTKYKVFKNLTELKGIDAETFRANPSKTILREDHGEYFKDKNSIYYFDKKIEGSDGSTANTSENDFCHDKNYIYSNGEIAYFGDETCQYVNYYFYKTKKFVFSQAGLVQGMNPDSLTALSESYARYKNDLYYREIKTPIKLNKSSKIKVWSANNQDRYITDGERFFRDGEEIYEKFDIPSFGFFSNSACFFDKNGIYELSYDKELKKDKIQKLPFSFTEEVNSKNSFYNQFSGILFYKNQAYATRTKSFYKDLTQPKIAAAKAQKNDIDDFDGSNKIWINYFFYKMNGHVYCNNKKTSFDAETFKRMDENQHYYKDKNVAFYYDEIDHEIKKLTDVDVKSERILDIFLIDKNYVYCRNVNIIKSNGVELLASFSGYRHGFCGNDSNPVSDFYLFKNSEGFWLVKISENISYRFLGKIFDRKWDSAFEAVDLAKKYRNTRIIIPQKPVREEKKSVKIDNEIYNASAVTIYPGYLGGLENFYAFIKKNYIVPKQIVKNKVSGNVYASIIIEKDGRISNIKVIRDIGYGSGEELERVLKLCPQWTPAMNNRQPVRCSYSFAYSIK